MVRAKQWAKQRGAAAAKLVGENLGLVTAEENFTAKGEVAHGYRDRLRSGTHGPSR